MDATVTWAWIYFILTDALIVYYGIILLCLLSCLNKSSTFILFTSQALNDIYALSQSAWHFGYLVTGVQKETFLSPRWLSILHGSFELISLPHYAVIAINRAMFLFDYTRMTDCFNPERTYWICGAMWLFPVLINLLLHSHEAQDQGGYYVFEPKGLGMGTETSAFQYKSLISEFFEYSFLATAAFVIVVYMIAIPVHGCHRRQLTIPENNLANRNMVQSRNFMSELRLTFVCLINLVPPLLTTIMNYAWPEKGTSNMAIYAFLTIVDNSINAMVLPYFSVIVREAMWTKLTAWFCCKTEVRRKSTPSLVFQLTNSAVAGTPEPPKAF